MNHFKQGCRILLIWLLATVCWGEISPISLTLFGIYGEPVYPPLLANPTPNAFGLNVLAEWNATTFTSFGLGFEQTTFYGTSNFTVPMLNFEGRLFPLENEQGKFSPYVYAGAGLNLAAAAAWQGPVQLKAGIGSRVSLFGPLFFDVAVGSHWLQPPNAFQYVDIRSGLSLSFGFKDRAPSSPKPEEKAVTHPTATPILTPVITPQMTPTPMTSFTPTPVVTQTAPVIEIPQAPVTTLSGVKKYYRLGMKAFLDRNYALSLKLLRKSLAAKEIHGAAYYYAETYATIGVIYQFHAHKVKDHERKALQNYRKALAIDPTTKSAKHYYKKLRAKVAKENKTKKRPKPKAVSATSDLAANGSPGVSDKVSQVGRDSSEAPTGK